MRVLRATYFEDPYRKPTVVIIRDGDVTDTLESIRESTSATMRDSLVVFDLFEMPDGDAHAATLEAGKRTSRVAEQEKHQAMLYYYFVAQFPQIRSGGVLFSDRPTPMSEEAIRVVLERLAMRSDYRDFSFAVPDRQGQVVSLDHGTLP